MNGNTHFVINPSPQDQHEPNWFFVDPSQASNYSEHNVKASDEREEQVLSLKAMISQITKLNQYFRYQDDWDGYHSSRPSGVAIITSILLIRDLWQKGFCPYFNVATPSGSIMLEVVRNAIHYRFEIGKSGLVESRQAVTKNSRTKEFLDIISIREVPIEIEKLLQELSKQET